MAITTGMAILGAAVIGAVASDKTSVRASRSADRATDFEMEKYDDWKEMYGELEQNLADFYNDMTPEVMTAAGLESEAESFQAGKTKVMETLAQRGFAGGAMEADILSEQEVESAERRAEIRRDAPLKVAEEKAKFMATKTPEKLAAQRGVSGALQTKAATEAAAAQEAQESFGDIVGAGLQYAGRTSGTPSKIQTVSSGSVPSITNQPLDFTPIG